MSLGPRLLAWWRSLPMIAKVAQIAALSLLAWGTTCGTRTALPAPVPTGAGDLVLYRAIVARVAAGDSYYRATGDELHRRGYATVPAFNWRLPTLALLLANLPSEAAAGRVLFGLGLLTGVLWLFLFVRSGREVLGLLCVPLFLSMVPAWGGDAVNFHEVWAGQLVALAVVSRLLGWLPVSVVAAGLALSIRELAVPAVVILAVMSWSDDKRVETSVWTLLLVVYGLALGWHLWHAASMTRPDALSNSWVSGGGWCYVLKTARTNPLFSQLPGPLVAALVSLSLAGLWAQPALGFSRVAAVVSVYLLAFALVGRPDNFYWGLMVAPLLPLGFVGWASGWVGTKPMGAELT